jgi:hypothetical protein
MNLGISERFFGNPGMRTLTLSPNPGEETFDFRGNSW